MRLIAKTLYYLILATIGLCLSVVLVAYTLFSRSLPDYDQTISSDRVNAPLEIVRDTYGVPHIFAKTDSDAYFGLGYAHAQDRLWQMELSRRKAQGRLADLFGADALDEDRRARQLGFYRLALIDERDLPLSSRAALDAYSAGVNAYLRQLAENPKGRGAPEFYFIAPEIAQWRPADSLAIIRSKAWEASTDLEAEIRNARLTLAIGPDRADQLIGAEPIVAKPFPTAVTMTNDRTVSGQSLLLTDAIGKLSAPTEVYFARLDLSSRPIFGMTYPGVPAIYMGFAPNLAWSVSEAFQDTADIAIVPDALLANKTEFEQRISVKDAATHTEVVSEFGTSLILPADLFGLDGLLPANHSAVLQWTGRNANDRTHEGLLAVSTLLDPTALEAAEISFQSPFDIVVASRFGIAKRHVGQSPSRTAWQGQRSDLPYLIEKEEAFWADLKPRETPTAKTEDLVRNTTASALKDQRIERLLTQREIHSLRSLMDLQSDTVSEAARSLLPLVARELWFSELPAPDDPLSNLRTQALDLLAEWNGDMSEHLPQPLIYSAWMWELQRQIIRDELGPVTRDFQEIRPAFIEAVFTNRNGMAKWCDIGPSAEIETCEDMALRSLNVAIQRLEDAYGSRVASWLWGEAHISEQTHSLFENGSWMDWATGIYQPISGSVGTINETFGPSADGVSFVTRAAPVARLAVDLSRSETSGFILSTGQSGHFLSEFYDNFAPFWRRSEYIPFSFDEEIVRAGRAGVITISPPN